ncbi:MAG: hypothetical protein ACJA01_003524 [Saprospiraceae bacterium]|jgi:hypothetical protein
MEESQKLYISLDSRKIAAKGETQLNLVIDFHQPSFLPLAEK